MATSNEVESQRNIGLEQRAPMQKLEISGHLLPGTDIGATNIQRFLEDLGPVCGMNIFNGPHVKTPDSYDPETVQRLGHKPDDVNGSLMWDDSGAQLYVFPNRGNYFNVDIYTCKSFDAKKALEFVYGRLHPREDMVFGETNHNVKTPWTEYVRPDGTPLNPESAYLPEMDKLFDIDLTDLDEVMAAGKRLEDIVGRAVANGVGDRLAASYTPAQREQLRSLHSDYEIAVDDKFMDDVLSGIATSPDQYSFQPTYDRLAVMESELVKNNKTSVSDRVMHIGTGWPGTAIGLYRQFGIPVTCVEKDPIVAQKSREALEKLGLLGDNKLQVVTADGTEVYSDNIAAVIVSAMVPTEDKKRIAWNMKKLATGTQDPILVLRSPQDIARSLFYQDLDPGMPISQQAKFVADTSSLITAEDPLKSLAFQPKVFSSVRGGFRDDPMDTRKKLQLV